MLHSVELDGLRYQPNTRLIGRETDIQAVRSAIRSERVVALLGPGGVGKTRLACAAAVEEEDFAVRAFVDLAATSNPHVAQAVVTALGILERPRQSSTEALIRGIGGQRCLLLLDNCEHVANAVAELVDLLIHRCPRATFLLTSRERLGLADERSIRIEPLSTSVSADGTPSDAATLFADRAALGDGSFSAEREPVESLVTRLDGIPLAIELAAARNAALGVHGLLQVMDDLPLTFAGRRGGNDRHRSLNNVLAWSYDLLPIDERHLFEQISIFRGRFDTGAAASLWDRAAPEAVPDLLGRLTDKSLVTRPPGAGAGGQWELLNTVRAFGLDHLQASDDYAVTRQRHAKWATRRALEVESLSQQEDPTWVHAFDAIIDDLRLAVTGMSATTAPSSDAHQLARSLGKLCYLRRLFEESQSHYELAAELAVKPTDATDDLQRAAEVTLAVHRPRLSGFDLLLRAADNARLHADKQGEISSLVQALISYDRFPADFRAAVGADRLTDVRSALETAAESSDLGDPAVAAYVLLGRSWSASPSDHAGRFDRALDLARQTGDPFLISAAIDAAAAAAAASGHLLKAREHTRERLDVIDRMPRENPHYAGEIVDALHSAVGDALSVGDLRGALDAAVALEHEDLIFGQPHLGNGHLVLPLMAMGRFDEALARADATWRGWLAAGRPPADWMASALDPASLIESLRNHPAESRLWRQRSRQSTAAKVGSPPADNPMASAAAIVFTDLRIALHQADGPAARRALRWAQNASRSSLWPFIRALSAEVAVAVGSPNAADLLTAVAPLSAESAWVKACLSRAHGRLDNDHAALADASAEFREIGAHYEHAATLVLHPEHREEGLKALALLGIEAPGTWPTKSLPHSASGAASEATT